MLSVANKPIMLNVIMLSVIMLSVIMLSVVMLNVVMLSVAAPERDQSESITRISKRSKMNKVF